MEPLRSTAGMPAPRTPLGEVGVHERQIADASPAATTIVKHSGLFGSSRPWPHARGQPTREHAAIADTESLDTTIQLSSSGRHLSTTVFFFCFPSNVRKKQSGTGLETIDSWVAIRTISALEFFTAHCFARKMLCRLPTRSDVLASPHGKAAKARATDPFAWTWQRVIISALRQ